MKKSPVNGLLLVVLCVGLSTATSAQRAQITVAQDGSGDFTTVQAALNTVPANNASRVVIRIKKGIYNEKLKLDSTQHFVTLIGEDKTSTVLTYDDYSGKVLPDGTKLRTSTSGSFYIFSNDFRAENLTFENTAGRRSGVPVGQAVAAFVTGDRAVFVNCRFLGNQDTLYTGMPDHPDRRPDARQYYKDCYIEGTVDFIFGSATAVFDNCTIFSKQKGTYVTAAATPEGKSFGYVFLNCTLTSDAPPASVYLGRPWRNFAKTVFVNCTLGPHIRPEGWHNWNKPDAEKTTLYAEYQSKGPGAAPDSRVSWSKQLTTDEANRYTPGKILAGNDQWKPDGKPTKNPFLTNNQQPVHPQLTMSTNKSRLRPVFICLSLLVLLGFTRPADPITVYLIGDSTMSIKQVSAYPETGWGMPFAHFFDASVTVDNRAMNGRSTRSFIEENRWQSVLTTLHEGDYVLIQFGHNDEVKTKKTYTTEAEFQANLIRFITESRDKKATPVLITPVARRQFDEAGQVKETHDVYSGLVRAVADESKTPLIDLDKLSQALLQQFGVENSKLLFLQLAPGEHPNYPEGKEDNTHFNELGARKMAELVLAAIKAQQLPLADRIVKPQPR